jgi:hypothetical protein
MEHFTELITLIWGQKNQHHYRTTNNFTSIVTHNKNRYYYYTILVEILMAGFKKQTIKITNLTNLGVLEGQLHFY